MKKTITKPDGSTETIEGTAEEIAEYERNLRKESLKETPPKKKDILKGKDLRKMFEELMEKKRQEDLYRLIQNPLPAVPSLPRLDHAPTCLIVRARSGWMSIVPPQCTCGLIAYPTQQYRYTYGTSTGNSTPKSPEDSNDGAWKIKVNVPDA